MGIIKKIPAEAPGSFFDQFRTLITPGSLQEHAAMVRADVQESLDQEMKETVSLEDSFFLRSGSVIQVPENTAALIFSGTQLEMQISEPGMYKYFLSQEDADDDEVFLPGEALARQTFQVIRDRIGFSSPARRKILYVNLGRIRNVKFGTPGPRLYHDEFYGTDLEVHVYGTLDLQITDAVRFVRNFAPAGACAFSFDSPEARALLLPEFLQSLMQALSNLSSQYRIPDLSGKAGKILQQVLEDREDAGSWETRYGFRLQKIAIGNIEHSDLARDVIHQLSLNQMKARMQEKVSRFASGIKAGDKSAPETSDSGEALIQAPDPKQKTESAMTSLEEQIEAVKKLKELADMGILSQEEFDLKKRKILGI